MSAYPHCALCRRVIYVSLKRHERSCALEQKKRKAVLSWFERLPASHRMRECVDVLNRDFVDHFVEQTGASRYIMPYGADKCPELGRVLSRMCDDRVLDRHRTGLDGMAGLGFPRWVYSYRLRS